LLAIGVGLIRRYGAQEPTVIQALLRMLTTVLTTGAPDLDMATAVQREANLLVAASEREVQEPADLAVVVYTEAETLRHALPARPAETSPARAAPGEQAPPPPT
jgi:uncharacterized membrane protein